ncbi:hypothetical protein, partial [Stenotrophomonas maltophilia group sp. LNF336]
SDVFMAMLRTGQTAAPPIKVADDARLENRSTTNPAGPKTPNAPPAMDRERIASRRHTNVTPADKRKHMVVDRVFDARATLCEVACQDVLAWLRDAKKP